MVWAKEGAMTWKFFPFQAGANPLPDSYIAEWSAITNYTEEVHTTAKIKECQNEFFFF